MDNKAVRYDKLTGLLNRESFEEKFKLELTKAKKNKAVLSLVLLDLDLFKQFNDKHGHEAGDIALKLLADAIKQTTNKDGISARYGADEFALVLPNTEREQAFLIAEKIRKSMDKTHKFNNKKGSFEGKITIKGGVAGFPVDGQMENEILRSADEALYRAHKTGRNRICISQETKMVIKTTHYTTAQLEKLTNIAKKEGIGEAILLREALDDLILKYKSRI